MTLEEQYINLKNKIALYKKQHKNTKTLERKFIMTTRQLLEESMNPRIFKITEKINKANRKRIARENFKNSFCGILLDAFVFSSIAYFFVLCFLLLIGGF